MPAKKLVTLFVSSLLFFLLLSSHFFPLTSNAQSPSPPTALEKAQTDYNFQYTKFREAEEKYKTARAAYISFKTAVSKNEAFEQTKAYLVQVDTLYLTFLFLVQENVNSLSWGTHGAQKDEIGNTISEEASFLKDHQTRVQNTKTLEELPVLSEELKNHIEDVLELKLNKVLATLEIIEAEEALDKFNSLSNILNRIVFAKIRAGDTKSILANWSSEVKNIKDETSAKTQEARAALEDEPKPTLRNNLLQRITEIANQADTQIKRSKPLFEELVRIL